MAFDKKIGMFTFHGNNYGAVLQAYALQKFLLQNISTEVEIIHVRTNVHSTANNIFSLRFPITLKEIILNFVKLIYYIPLKKKQQRFDLFRKKFLRFTERTYSSELELELNIPQEDYFITGSDQVFNPNNNLYKMFYLNYISNGAKKIAYAPSFGISQFDAEQISKIKSLLVSFDYLSCREEQGVTFISNLLNIEIPLVCDPVFLLEPKEWDKVLIRPNYSFNYIFVYDLNGGEKLLKLAQKIKDETGYKIICCTDKVQRRYKEADIILYSLGPRELIGYIKDADYVVTDSFHGTALSLIFKTKVISYVALKSVSSRLLSLVNVLKIYEQLFFDVNDFHFYECHFRNYSEPLELLRQKSMNFLYKAFI